MKNEALAVVKPIRTLEDALNRCQTLGMRLSRQRRFILELLWHAKEHLSAREIYDRLNQQGKNIGHTSVYQNLEALSSQGIIECIERSEGRLYGNITDSHSHIHCLDNDEIIDVYVELPEELILQIEQQTGIRIADYRINFYGTRVEPKIHCADSAKVAVATSLSHNGLSDRSTQADKSEFPCASF